jgi:hypothetical protein
MVHLDQKESRDKLDLLDLPDQLGYKDHKDPVVSQVTREQQGPLGE